MSTFTMTLSEIMEDHGVDTVDDAVPMATIFGLDKYPLFDETYRAQLNRKIIARFWNREIGQETDEMFRHRMDTRMREIMVEKNQLYLSEQIKFDPMHTMDMRTVMGETGTGTLHGETLTNQDTTENGTVGNVITGETTGKSDTTKANTKDTTADVISDATSTKNAKSRSVSSVMPQNQLSENGDYADGAQDAVSDGNDTTHNDTNSVGKEIDAGTTGVIESGTSSSDGLETTSRTGSNDQTGEVDSNTTSKTDRTSSTIGYQAMPSQLLQQYRDTILNIDLDILTLLERLFMSVTSNGDEYFYEQGHRYDLGYWYY